MAREIDRLRLVMSGISKGPTKMWAEYQIVDGDLREKAVSKKFKGTDFTKTIGDLWNDTKATISLEESI